MLAPVREWLGTRIPWLQTASPEHFGYRAMQPLSPESSTPFSAGGDRFNQNALPLLRSQDDGFHAPSDLDAWLGGLYARCTLASLTNCNTLRMYNYCVARGFKSTVMSRLQEIFIGMFLWAFSYFVLVLFNWSALFSCRKACSDLSVIASDQDSGFLYLAFVYSFLLVLAAMVGHQVNRAAAFGFNRVRLNFPAGSGLRRGL